MIIFLQVEFHIPLKMYFNVQFPWTQISVQFLNEIENLKKIVSVQIILSLTVINNLINALIK